MRTLVVVACGERAPDAPTAAREVTVETTAAFTEGPTVAEDGMVRMVCFSDLGNDRITRLSPDGRLSTFRAPSHRARA